MLDTRTLTELPIGRPAVVAAIHPIGADSTALMVRTEAMGLHVGSCVEVLRRNGRLLLVQVGAVQLAVSSDFACVVEVE
jgi:Fe2+ transport system protein FeoA